MGSWRSRALPRVALVLAFAALLGHVCADDAGAHDPMTAAAAADPGHAHPAEASGLHAASCLGVKVDPTVTICFVVGNWTGPTVVAAVRESPDVPDLVPPARPSALYLLHASLRL